MAEPTPAGTQDGQNDLAILFPDRTTTITGRAITMREYRFAESLDHHAAIARFTDAITGVALRGDFYDLDSLRAPFGECRQDVIQLIAIACDQPVEWVAGLEVDPGEQLMLLWWAVNAAFFLKRVITSVVLQKAREMPDPTAGLTSSPASSPTDTAPAISASTPSVN